MNNDLISREALKKQFGYTDEWYKGRTVCAIIDNAPTVEITETEIQEVLNKRCMTAVANEYLVALHGERPHGKWIKTQEDRWIYPICSECGYKENVVTNYCANCGAKMDKEDK